MTAEQSTTTVIDTLHAGVIVNASNGLTRTLSVERGAQDGTLNVVAQRDTGALGDGRVTAGLAISRAAWLQIRETADAILGTGGPSYTRADLVKLSVPEGAAVVWGAWPEDCNRLAYFTPVDGGPGHLVVTREDDTGARVLLDEDGRTAAAAAILGLTPEQVVNFSQQAKSTPEPEPEPEPEPVKLVDLLPKPVGELAPADVLRRAATIVETPGRWIQNKLATDAKGRSTDHASATCACAIGALMLADPGARSVDGEYIAGRGERYRQATDALTDRIGDFSIPRWNDTKGRTAEEVATTMRQAADDLEAPKTPLGKVLTAAADLLAEPGAWTRGEYAKDAQGKPAIPTAPEATCYCALGAVALANEQAGKILGPGRYTAGAEVSAALRDAGVLPEHLSVPNWNDAPERTQVEVVEGLRRAATHVEAEAAQS